MSSSPRISLFGRLLTGACLAVVALLPAFATPQASDDARARVIDGLLDPYDVPGAPGGALVISQGGRVIYTRAFGLADLDLEVPNTPQTVFHVASISKQFTAFAIALLARDGKVDLDADIRTYLPYVPDFGSTITVRHLLYHTSGLRDQWSLFVLGGHDMRDVLHQQHVLNLVRRQRALNFAPGAEHLYSNTNYTLLAEIVRVVSGRSLREFAAERIFQPLGMTQTFFRESADEVVPRRAQSYYKRAAGDSWRHRPLNYETAGATSLQTTILDMARWAANFSHPVVGDRALIEQISQLGSLNDGSEINYAFGLRGFIYAGHQSVNHNGSDAAYQSMFAWFPESDFAFCMVVNRNAVALRAIMETLVETYLGPGELSRGWPTRLAPDPELAREVAGRYATPYLSSLHFLPDENGLRVKQEQRATESVDFWSDGTFGVGPHYRAHFRAVRDEAGRVIAVERVSHRDRTLTRYDRFETAAPTAAQLAALAGRYHSPELEITYTLSVEQDHLVARSLWSIEPFIFQPLTPDRFEFDASELREGVMVPSRAPDGAVTGILLHTNRVRHVLLERLPES